MHHDADTAARLALLRASLDALGPGDDLPDRVRLDATLQALDPALGGDLLGPAAWVASTGMPAPSWHAKLAALRTQMVRADDQAEVPDDAVVRAMALDPEFGARLLARRTFVRFLRRNPVFPGAPEVRAFGEDEEPWFVVDGLLSDGRWWRVRVAGAVPRRPPPGGLWATLPMDELEGEVGYDTVRRCVVGPVYDGADGRAAGLFATLEASGAEPVRRLAIDRMQAEDLDVDAVVIPMALPAPTE